VDPEVLMASLFQATDLEIRFSMNMNVLGADHVPRVMNLREVLQAFLDHRHEVLVRRSNHRLRQIDHRLEVLGGYLAAYLNLDEVIRIIREEDEPKQELIRAFTLTDVQADAILNMRLRNLRKLEEMEIRREHDALTKEKNGLLELLGDEALRWKRIAEGVAEIKKKFGTGALGKRRTDVADAPAVIEVPLDALVEREPVTVICSAKGWIRTVRGHLTDAEAEDVKYKDGDSRGFIERCETTDKLLVFASNGKFFTIGVDKLPRGRGFGEPVRLMIDLGNDVDIVDLFRHQPGRTLMVVSEDGRGFRVEEAEVLAQTRAGKQVLNLEDGKSARICHRIAGDHALIVGTNNLFVIFPVSEIPVLTRGKGEILQRYKDSKILDVRTFNKEEGYKYTYGNHKRSIEMSGNIMKKGSSGRICPAGMVKDGKLT
jgi:topoisomerase-4 subunit A